MLEIVSDLTIDPLAKHPDLVELTVDWHLSEFDAGGDRDFWLRARSDEARSLSGVPRAWGSGLLPPAHVGPHR
jgi:hypothetical protein